MNNFFFKVHLYAENSDIWFEVRLLNYRYKIYNNNNINDAHDSNNNER